MSIKNREIVLEISILTIVNVVSLLVYLFVELTVHFVAGEYSKYLRHALALGLGIMIVVLGMGVDKKLRNIFLLGPKHGMNKQSPLDGITFIWWIPIAITPASFMYYFMVKYSGLEVESTRVGPFFMLYVAIVALELRKYLITARKSQNSGDI